MNFAEFDDNLISFDFIFCALMELVFLLACWSFVNTMLMMSLSLQLWQLVITNLVAVTMTILLESLRWRLKICRASIDHCLINTWSWISCWCCITSSDSRIHPRITSCFALSEIIRISCSVVVDYLSWISWSRLSMMVIQMRIINGLMRFMCRIPSWTSTRSLWMSRLEHVTWLHVGQDLRESLPIPSNSLTRISKRQFLPSVEINCLAIHIDQILFAGCTRLWSQMPLTKHSIIFIGSTSSLSR